MEKPIPSLCGKAAPILVHFLPVLPSRSYSSTVKTLRYVGVGEAAGSTGRRAWFCPDGAQNRTKSERGGPATLIYKSKKSKLERGRSIGGPVYAVESPLHRSASLRSTRAADDGQTKARE
jgi:hypothetical protein